jgi:hypothetical protein
MTTTMNPKLHLPMMTLAAALLAGACAAVEPARMALPDALAATTAEPFDGLRYGREGRFTLAGQPVRYQRGADRLDLFERLGRDKVWLRFELDGATGATRADCGGRRLEGAVGVIAAALQPLVLTCRFDGARPAQLELKERGANTGVGRDEREGRLTIGNVALELRSVHALQGSPLPLAQPAGYLMLHQGQPVAAVELTDSRPVLRRTPEAPPEAVTLAAVALGLLWDPATLAR